MYTYAHKVFWIRKDILSQFIIKIIFTSAEFHIYEKTSFQIYLRLVDKRLMRNRIRANP